jgi:mediator of RNA polymerase II transcription subunit 7
MADQQDPHSLASTFPNPPSFWRDFTAEKIARIETLRQAYATEKQLDKANAVGATTTEGDGAAAATPALLLPARIPGVPDDLALLQPPPEPADGRWRVFGDQYMVSKGTLVQIRDPMPVELADQELSLATFYSSTTSYPRSRSKAS